jgi:REP element-mobilizing transposase RayT
VEVESISNRGLISRVGGLACLGPGGGQQSHHIARAYLGRRQSFVGQHFWARGYCVSTVGRDEASIREYIQKQQEEKKRLDYLTMLGE